MLKEASLQAASEYPDSSYPGSRMLAELRDGPLPTSCDGAARNALVTLDRSKGQPLQLGQLWPCLRAGQLRFSKVFAHGHREYALLAEGPPAAEGALTQTEERMIELLVRGVSQKVVAIDFGIAASTVSMHTRAGLARLGLRCSVSRLPLLINLVVMAGLHPDRFTNARLSEPRRGLLLVSMAWPKESLLLPLSGSERQVIELLIAGLSNWEISEHRGTSPRTVANQLAACFAKLRLSGRTQLMAHLASEALQVAGPATHALDDFPAASAPSKRASQASWAPHLRRSGRLRGASSAAEMSAVANPRRLEFEVVRS